MSKRVLRTILSAPNAVLSAGARYLGLPPPPAVRLRYGSIRTIEQFLRAADGGKERPGGVPTLALDLGCGGVPRNPFNASSLYGVDIRACDERHVVEADLSCNPIPFASNTFDFVTCYDFLEHVPRVGCGQMPRFPFVELMSEVHRVLKSGGLLFAKTPAYPFSQVFQDPTHVNVITEETFPVYFCVGRSHPLARAYGFQGAYELVSQKWWGGAWLLCLMRKVGP